MLHYKFTKLSTMLNVLLPALSRATCRANISMLQVAVRRCENVNVSIFEISTIKLTKLVS